MSSLVLERKTAASLPKLTSQRGRKRLALFSLLVVVGLGAAWYGDTWWEVGRFIESTDDAYVGGDVTAISPHVAGFVSQILVRDNQRVHAGQLLVRLDDRDFQAAVDHAEAVVRGQEATLASLGAKYVLQQSTIRQADADLAAKTAQAAFAREDELRYRSLVLTNAGSRQDAQRALATNQQAASAVASSQAGLAAATQQFKVLDTEIAQAKAAIAQAQADLQGARLNLGYTQIRSPIDGYIGNRAAQVGGYVSGGAYLLTVIPAQNLWVDANFKENQLAQMTPGLPATVVADILPGHVFHGQVLSLAPGTGAVFSVIPPENATGNFTKIVQRLPVRIELDAGDAMLGQLRAGLSTTVSVDTHSASESVK